MSSFSELGLSKSICSSTSRLGYESPTPIQSQSIPIVLSGKDLLAQAQTGTGKTAAFALPLLDNIDLSEQVVQVLVLTPTRELALQVAESFQNYAKDLPKKLHVLPVYGGQSYSFQIKSIKRGCHVIVGTPGRLIDLINRRVLDLKTVKSFILDEADEMLRMGFIDEVELIMQQTPEQKQVALFSATMPDSIVKIANNYLVDPVKIKIVAENKSVSATEQYYSLVLREHKMEALTRFLEVDDFDAVLIFVRTKTMTAELAEKLEAHGYSSVAALNGDMSQNLREKVVDRLKKKALDIVVATDVAARGLDVDHISYVINYDIPYDTESYIHRIGRTGRAGRSGKALLLISPKERKLLRDIEKAIKQKIDKIDVPSAETITYSREEKMQIDLQKYINKKTIAKNKDAVLKLIQENDCEAVDLAAALLGMINKFEKPTDIKFDVIPQQSKKPYKDGKKRDFKGKDFKNKDFKNKDSKNKSFKKDFKKDDDKSYKKKSYKDKPFKKK